MTASKPESHQGIVQLRPKGQGIGSGIGGGVRCLVYRSLEMELTSS